GRDRPAVLRRQLGDPERHARAELRALVDPRQAAAAGDLPLLRPDRGRRLRGAVPNTAGRAGRVPRRRGADAGFGPRAVQLPRLRPAAPLASGRGTRADHRRRLHEPQRRDRPDHRRVRLPGGVLMEALMRWLLPIIFTLSACAAPPPARPERVTGEAPLLAQDLAGSSLDIDAALARGERVALVFWQTWCSSCADEAPAI